MTAISDRYRKVAQGLTDRVNAVPDDKWAAPSPCEGWVASDVMSHVVDAHHMFFGFIGHEPSRTKTVADDPAGAWAEVRDAMAAALENPDLAGTEYDGPFGRSKFETSADQFVTGDVLVHSWDLARATGGDETLDPDEAAKVYETYKGFGDNVRHPQVFGPEVAVPDDASAQDRLIAFTGRDPR